MRKSSGSSTCICPKILQVDNTLRCSKCYSTNIDSDASRGHSVCIDCGCVVESSLIVTDADTFMQDSSGKISVMGTFVKDSGALANSKDSSFIRGEGVSANTSDSSSTVVNARRNIEQVASQLRLNTHCVEAALNFYKLALMKGITRSRPNIIVVSACLYLVCRTEGLPHLLIDFAEVSNSNPFVIGRIFCILCQELNINVSLSDPALLVPRFAHSMQLGKMTHKVANTAINLIGRMRRDWLSLGRRPSGLVGAALLVAARYHGFNRSTKDVTKIIKMQESTLRKRLKEFASTPSALLSLDEFFRVDLEEECDPPSFTQSSRNRSTSKSKPKSLTTISDEQVLLLKQEIEDELENKRKKRKMALTLDAISNENSRKLDEEAITTEYINQEVLQPIFNEIDNHVSSLPSHKLPPIYLNALPSEGLSLKEKKKYKSKTEKREEGSENQACKEEDKLDLTGIDDSELDDFILCPTDAALKSAAWHKEFSEFEEEQKIKREFRDNKLKELEGKPRKKYKKRNVAIVASSSNEAIQKVIIQKKLSGKINYDVLASISKDDPSKPEASWRDVKENNNVMSSFSLPSNASCSTAEFVDIKINLENRFNKRLKFKNVFFDEKKVKLSVKENINETIDKKEEPASNSTTISENKHEKILDICNEEKAKITEKVESIIIKDNDDGENNGNAELDMDDEEEDDDDLNTLLSQVHQQNGCLF